MLTLSSRHQIAIAVLLALLMILTRSHHFASMHHLADASWAIFFLVGIYLRPVWSLPAFFALSWWLDFAAYTWGGVSGFCLTPAYVFLLPAYGSLWLAGRWFAKRYQFGWRTAAPLAASSFLGLTLCELFSSGGFYFFSGRFADTTIAEFGTRLMTYFPLYAEAFATYLGIAIVLHSLFAYLSTPVDSHTPLIR